MQLQVCKYFELKQQTFPPLLFPSSAPSFPTPPPPLLLPLPLLKLREGQSTGAHTFFSMSMKNKFPNLYLNSLGDKAQIWRMTNYYYYSSIKTSR